MKNFKINSIAKFVIVFYFGIAFPAHAKPAYITDPSFPCGAANNLVEKTVCADTDGDLQRMDRTVHNNYMFLIRVLGSEGNVITKEVHLEHLDRPSLAVTDHEWRRKLNGYVKDKIAISMYGDKIDTSWNEEYLTREIWAKDKIETEYKKKLPHFIFAEYSQRLGNINWILYQWLKEKINAESLKNCDAFDMKSLHLNNLINYYTVLTISPEEYLVQIPCAIVSTNWMYRFARANLKIMAVTPLSGSLYNMEGSYFTLDFDPFTMIIHHYRGVSHPERKTGLACIEENLKVGDTDIKLVEPKPEENCMAIMNRLLEKNKEN